MRWTWVGAAGLALALAGCGANGQDRAQGDAVTGTTTAAQPTSDDATPMATAPIVLPPSATP